MLFDVLFVVSPDISEISKLHSSIISSNASLTPSVVWSLFIAEQPKHQACISQFAEIDWKVTAMYTSMALLVQKSVVQEKYFDSLGSDLTASLVSV